MKQKAELVNEIASLKVELQQAKDDRDRHLMEVKTLQTEATKYNDFKDSITELEVSYTFIISSKNIFLCGLLSSQDDVMFLGQTTCSSQSSQIRELQDRLVLSERRLQVLSHSQVITNGYVRFHKFLSF